MDFMSRLEMILTLILLVSLGINGMLFVYSRNVAQKLVLISDEINDMRAAVSSFAEHVKAVYEMEMFYGDQTLQALMDHARSFREYMDEFETTGKGKNRLIIFDDVGYSGNLKSKNFGIITKLISNGRHLNLSQIYTSQRFTMISTALRSNITGAILFGTSSKELELIAEDYNYLANKKSFINLFRRETATPRSFLVINFTNKDGLYMDSMFNTIKMT